jgi:hypothetical protein
LPEDSEVERRGRGGKERVSLVFNTEYTGAKMFGTGWVVINRREYKE